ncbi:MAG: SurA N-terminal domain-containing protein [Candidatus Dojkabacteria bacterium]|jgi:hypothetical protein|nr:SurA N-terminal domain-containing protein [Candidatus Dojkabacteria bacterium]
MAKAKSKPVKTEKSKGVTLRIKKPTIPKIKISKPNLENYKKFIKPALVVLVVILSFFLIDLAVQYLNNGYSVAVVNGVRISKGEYHEKLEKLYGQSTAKQLIDEEIIRQEAQKADVKVEEEEVQIRLDEIISSIGGQESYEAALVANNLTEEELRDQIELDLILKNILEPSIEYTDDDVKAFFDQYSAVIFPNETAALEDGEKLDYELYREKTVDVYLQQEVENKKYTWIDGLYGEYRIQDNSVEKPKYGVFTTTVNIIKNLTEKANSNDTE